MAKKFSEITNGRLGLYDIIRSGKYVDRLVIVIVNDDPEYLMWMQYRGFFSYTQEVIDAIHEAARFEKEELPIDYLNDWESWDVPF